MFPKRTFDTRKAEHSCIWLYLPGLWSHCLQVFLDTVPPAPTPEFQNAKFPFSPRMAQIGPALFWEAVSSNNTNSLLIPRPPEFFSGSVLSGVPSAKGTANH